MGRGNQYNLNRLTAVAILLLAFSTLTACPVNRQSAQTGPSGKPGTTSPAAQAAAPLATPDAPALSLTPLPDWPADRSLTAYA